MGFRTVHALTAAFVVVPLLAVVLIASPATAATMTATRDAATATAALADSAAGAVSASSLPVIPPANAGAECDNDIDDDGDGFIDFTAPAGETADPDCISASDGVEQADFPAECSNEFDDDGDGFIDFTPPAGETADPGCASGADNNEVEGEPDPEAACANGFDDDGDGFIDFAPPAGETKDLGCDSASDLDEGSEGFPGQVGNPLAVVSSPLAGFPTSGSTFTVLSSGDALIADDDNTDSGSGFSAGGGGGGHGESFHDLVTLKLDVTVPAGANCLAIDFKFMSEEFPEYVGGSVNDGFVAELNVSDFTADADNNNAVIAPHNFAFDSTGKVISINTAGFSDTASAGTTYDGSTPLLRASTPVTSGSHSVYLSVFDQGDSVFDSAAFVDNLRIFQAPAGGCITGSTSDLTPPDTNITGGPTGTTNDNTPTFTFTSTEAGSTFECRIEAGAWAACTTPYTSGTLSDGAHTFEVRAIDAAGNVDATPASRAFTVETVDDTPPDTNITSGPSGPTNDSTPTFAFTSTEVGSTFECRVDSGTFASCTSPFTTTTLADGSHTFEVRAIDADDHTDPTPATQTFTVDTTPPDTTITSGPTGTTADTTPTFAFTSTEAGSTFECKIDAGAFIPCTTPFTTSALSDGPHTIQVRATDAVGNVDATPASRAFTVDTTDTTAPDTSITAGPSGPTNDSTPTFSFTSTEAGSTFECQIDAGAFVACTTPFTTNALADGALTFQVRAVDSLGNTDATPASRSFTVDTSAPDTTITSGPGPITTDHTPTFAFVASEAGATYQCKIDGGAFTACSASFTTSTLPDGGHTFQVRAADALGNVDATPASYTFTVTTPAPVATCEGKPATIVGTTGSDTLVGTGGDDVIVGLGGDDDITGGGGNDLVCGGGGDDKLQGGGGKDSLVGNAGQDKIDAGSGKDIADGGAGKDRIVGGGGADTIDGGDADDRITGNGDNDKVDGGDGDDVIIGSAGDDKLTGGSGTDKLTGAGGADTLTGNGGDDYLDGGPGKDSGNGGSGTNVVINCEN